MIAYSDFSEFVDLLLSKHKHNGTAARRFLLVLGAPFDVQRVRCVGAFIRNNVNCYVNRNIFKTFYLVVNRLNRILGNKLIKKRFFPA